MTDKVAGLEERLTVQMSAGLEKVKQQVDEQESAMARMKRQRDSARLRVLVAQGRLSSQRRAQGLQYSDDMDKCSGYFSSSSSLQQSDEEELEESELAESDEDEEGSTNEQVSETLPKDLSTNPRSYEDVKVVRVDPNKKHQSLTFLTRKEVARLRTASRHHAVLVRRSWERLCLDDLK